MSTSRARASSGPPSPSSRSHARSQKRPGRPLSRDIQQRFGLDALEVTDEIFESAASVVFGEAENRMHTIKAVLIATLAR